MAIATEWLWNIVEWRSPDGSRFRSTRIVRATATSTVTFRMKFYSFYSMPSFGGFFPILFCRSNTWPLPRPDNYSEPDESGSNKCSNKQLANSKCNTIVFGIGNAFLRVVHCAHSKNRGRARAFTLHLLSKIVLIHKDEFFSIARSTEKKKYILIEWKNEN